jgi:hypothetical protein
MQKTENNARRHKSDLRLQNSTKKQLFPDTSGNTNYDDITHPNA